MIFGKLIVNGFGKPGYELLDGYGKVVDFFPIVYPAPAVSSSSAAAAYGGYCGVDSDTPAVPAYNSYSWSMAWDTSDSGWSAGQDWLSSWSQQTHVEISGYHYESPWGTVDTSYQVHSWSNWNSFQNQYGTWNNGNGGSVSTQSTVQTSGQQSVQTFMQQQDSFEFRSFMGDGFVSSESHSDYFEFQSVQASSPFDYIQATSFLEQHIDSYSFSSGDISSSYTHVESTSQHVEQHQGLLLG